MVVSRKQPTMAAIQRVVVLNQRRRRSRSHVFRVNFFIRQNFSPLDILPEVAILKKFRLPRQQIMELLDLLRPALARPTRRSCALSPDVQLLAALRFFATGSFIEVVGEGYGLSKTSVWRCVRAVTDALLRHAGDWIRLPATRQEVQEVHQGCHTIAGIPRVLGLVDGTLIPLANPSVLDQAYISRKGYAALNIQVVVDHRGVISDLVAKWPGSTHDSFVWANSAVGEQAGRGAFGQSVFLGDSGYPLRRYLFTPVTNPQTRAERAFNVAHMRTRNIVERAIGVWKLRFRCLHKSAGGLRMKPQSSCAVTVATAMLHNMAVRGDAPLPEGEEEEANEEEDGEGGSHVFNPPQRAALHAAGVEARQRVIETVFG